jgi:predicted N-acetyltransferase YhbS
VMRAGLDHVRTLDSSAVLETTNRTNLSYYQRFGWETVNTIDCSTPSTVWVLRHDLHQ